MKIKLLLQLVYCFFLIKSAVAQPTPPPIEWQKSLGDSKTDVIYDSHQTSDGGYILCGYFGATLGANGDAWVVKLDAAGNIQWQKTYGGTLTDKAIKITIASDGGYVVGCLTNSTDGDVTGNHGYFDYWVFKVDNSGNFVWKKTFGGSGEDELNSVRTTSDGGYIVAGSTQSAELTGYHGGKDAWILKLSADGLIYWKNCYGGTYTDVAYDIAEINGDYVLAGSSYSINGDLTINYGSSDAWFAKLSSVDGAVIWSNSYGGSGTDEIYSLQQTQDPNASIVAAGQTTSNNYNVSGNHGLTDLWMVTVEGNNGILVSANCYGGSLDECYGYERSANVQTTIDGGYLLTTSSTSNDGDVSGHHGSSFYPDFWILKLNRGKTIDWQLSAGGSLSDIPLTCLAANDGGYLICGYTGSNDFDVSGNHNNSWDGWALKLSNCFVPPVSTATITAGGPACGGNVTLTVPGGIGYTYQWKRNGSNVSNLFFNNYYATTPGTYTCTVSNGTCGAINSPNIIVSIKPVATIAPSGTVNKCAADNVNFTANTGPGLTYQWYKGNVAIPGAVNSSFTTKKPGKYKVLVTNTVTQCSKNSPVTTVINTCRESIASAEATDENSSEIFSAALLEQNIPNPFISSSIILYRLPQKFTDAQITVTDITGRVVKRFALSVAGKGTLTFNASMLAQGVYVYSMYVDGKFIDSKRMVVIK